MAFYKCKQHSHQGPLPGYCIISTYCSLDQVFISVCDAKVFKDCLILKCEGMGGLGELMR
jgi:hypothetical protein